MYCASQNEVFVRVNRAKFDKELSLYSIKALDCGKGIEYNGQQEFQFHTRRKCQWKTDEFQ